MGCCCNPTAAAAGGAEAVVSALILSYSGGNIAPGGNGATDAVAFPGGGVDATHQILCVGRLTIIPAAVPAVVLAAFLLEYSVDNGGSWNNMNTANFSGEQLAGTAYFQSVNIAQMDDPTPPLGGNILFRFRVNNNAASTVAIQPSSENVLGLTLAKKP